MIQDTLTPPNPQTLEAVKTLLLQFEGLQYCQNLLEQVASAQAALSTHQTYLTESTEKLSTIDQTLLEKEQAFEARMASKRAAILASLKDVQAQLDRKQQDLSGWQQKAAQDVAQHDALIREMQHKLAQVQKDYQQTVSALETARTQHANFVKSLAGAV